MNYLAHAYLSFNYPEVVVGNIISDFVKGKQQFAFPKEVQVGIRLHRLIDSFTDSHKEVKSAKNIFKAEIGLYAGAFVDIAFDYFLANDTSVFASEQDLILFTKKVYELLNYHHKILPDEFVKIFPHMQQYNWLWGYSKTEGIAKSFAGVTRRAKYINKSHAAFDLFISQELHLQKNYNMFIEDITDYSKTMLKKLLSDI